MKIGIVNDIKLAVEALKRMIESSSNHRVVWVAYDGSEAVEKCAIETPDLILMDLIMPQMGGAEATRRIMKDYPCAILIVTASVAKNSSQVFEAMGYGALDVIKTPALDISREDLGGEELLKKIDRIGLLFGKSRHLTKEEQKSDGYYSEKERVDIPPLLVIGSSTGGPKALAKIIEKFPKKMPFSTVIIQHVDAEFVPGFARWLHARTSHPIQVVTHGMALSPGIIYVAGRNDHLELNEKQTLYYNEQPLENPYRPSVDVFFSSVAQFWPKKSVAVLLTGMGSDGAAGLKKLKDAGWHTIVEHESTCVVYGMPKAAIELNAASEVLPLEDISKSILDFFFIKDRREI